MTFTEEVQREFDHHLLYGNGYATRAEKEAGDAEWDRKFTQAMWLDAFDAFVKKNDLIGEAVRSVLSRRTP